MENAQLAGWAGTKRAIILNVQRQPGANVIEVVRQIRAEIPKLQKAVPAGVDLTVVSERTVTRQASVRDV
ncbi:efflux RND transporter permease subunit, partial [Acinetobacter baumannii]